MKDFYIFACSLEYIENNLSGGITQEDIAAHCCCSLSALQKIWKYCTHGGIMTYVKKRRITLAAADLRRGEQVLDTAVKYGYGSNEAFTRAFRNVWGVNPSEFARSRSFTSMYPKINKNYYNGGTFMSRTRFDLTELYDKLQDKKGTYLACFDIKNLHRINTEIGRKAGDDVISACVEHIDSALSENMMAFRIGGDEFVVATGCTSPEDAAAFVKKVTDRNGETIQSCGETLTIHLHSGIMLYGEDSEREAIYDRFENSLDRAKP